MLRIAAGDLSLLALLTVLVSRTRGLHRKRAQKHTLNPIYYIIVVYYYCCISQYIMLSYSISPSGPAWTQRTLEAFCGVLCPKLQNPKSLNPKPPFP